MMDAFAPPASVVVKLGSIMVHAEEALSPGGHLFDLRALRQLLADPEVLEWREAAAAFGLLPVPRNVVEDPG